MDDLASLAITLVVLPGPSAGQGFRRSVYCTSEIPNLLGDWRTLYSTNHIHEVGGIENYESEAD